MTCAATLSRRGRGMNLRFDFAVAEALRRKLLDGWLPAHGTDLHGLGQPSAMLRRPEY